MTFTIESDAPRYLYQKMADHIAGRIEAGELKPNKLLPAERRLADEYGVSLGTARRATQLLRERGLVLTLRSKGTFTLGQDKGTNQPSVDATLNGGGLRSPVRL